jgi:hypothetical protein
MANWKEDPGYMWRSGAGWWIEWGEQPHWEARLALQYALGDPLRRPVVLSFLTVPRWTIQECQRVISVLSSVDPAKRHRIRLTYIFSAEALGRIRDGIKATRGTAHLDAQLRAIKRNQDHRLDLAA